MLQDGNYLYLKSKFLLNLNKLIPLHPINYFDNTGITLVL